jgi:hypothetical protein
MKTFTSYTNDITRIIGNTDTDTNAWCLETLNDSTRYLVTKYYFNERSYIVNTAATVQFYNLPPQVKKLINLTVFIGTTRWQPKECPSREYWDYLNTQTFNQDYPSFFFVYNGQVGLWPVPASGGNPITMNYKTRIVDLAMADVTNVTASSTVSITTNTTAVVASGATFKQWMAGQWIRIPYSSTDSADGDNQWYQIATVTDGQNLVLMNPYTGATVTGANFTIGQASILPEDYQDLPLYRMAQIYFTTRLPDTARAALYEKEYDKGFEALNDEFGSKTTSIVLPDTSMPIYNPNIFVSGITQS